MEWISVKDRLPEIGEDVWATDGVSLEYGFRSAVDSEPSKWCDFWFTVSHWQPAMIPEPKEIPEKDLL